jgi:uncharacterized membrane protein YraQ (UPF0718 family)
MKKMIKLFLIVAFFVFILVSFLFDFESGKAIGYNFFEFVKDMILLIPCAFILIGLFEVWVKRETIERHLGEESGIKGFFWAIILAGTTIGGLYVAFPLAFALRKKGAKLSVIFAYLGASAVCRIPMTLFEASFVGVKFTVIRWATSIPLIIISSIILEKLFQGKTFGQEVEVKIKKGEIND